MMIVLLTTVLFGVVVSPELQNELFNQYGTPNGEGINCTNTTIGEEKHLFFNPSEDQTQLLAFAWRDEMDASFETILHTLMTLYTTTTYSNYYKIFGLLWLNEFRYMEERPGFTNLIPAKIIATVFIVFFMIFTLCTDCILVAVCVQGELTHLLTPQHSSVISDLNHEPPLCARPRIRGAS